MTDSFFVCFSRHHNPTIKSRSDWPPNERVYQREPELRTIEGYWFLNLTSARWCKLCRVVDVEKWVGREWEMPQVLLFYTVWVMWRVEDPIRKKWLVHGRKWRTAPRQTWSAYLENFTRVSRPVWRAFAIVTLSGTLWSLKHLEAYDNHICFCILSHPLSSEG